MAKKKGFFGNPVVKKIMNMIYGLGAAVVIAGALFKLEHWEGASEMLIIGMTVEAGVFILSAFDFPAEDYEWERVYPELADESYVPKKKKDPKQLDTSGMDAMSKAFKELDGGVFAGLTSTLKGLDQNVSKLSSVTDAAGATNDYATKIKAAAGKIDTLNKSYSVAVDSMGSFANAAGDAKAYHQQVQSITKNLKSLNSIYELELQDAKTHLKSLNQFYGSMTQAMNSMVEAGKDAEQYKKGMADLNKNISRLNSIYGNMLSAMAGSRS